MGRRPEGWKVRFKRGWAYVCFTHQSVEHRIALGTRDAGEAARAAAHEYASIVSGRRRRVRRQGAALFDLEGLIAQWLTSLDGELDEETIKTCVIYGRKYLGFFKQTDALTSESIGDYVTSRMRQVTRSTMLKERTFLRRFLRWCVSARALSFVPEFPELPAITARGTRSGKQRVKPVEITPAEAAEILSALPDLSKRIGKRRWPVRDRFAFAWETGLRPETIARIDVPRSWQPGSTVLELHDEDDKARYGRDVPLSDEAIRILTDVAPAHGVVFGSHNFSKRIKRAAIAVLGPVRGKRFAPYDFRHGRAQQLVDATGDLAGVAYMLGHKRLSTTDRYLRGSRRAAERVLAGVRIHGRFPHQEGSHAKKSG